MKFEYKFFENNSWKYGGIIKASSKDDAFKKIKEKNWKYPDSISRWDTNY